MNNESQNWEQRYYELEKEFEEFAYVVSHDFYAPLRHISGFTQILLGELPELSDQQKLYEEMIIGSVKEAELSLDALLEYSRMNTDEKYFIDLDISRIIEGVLKKLRPHIDASDAQINVGDMPEKVLADEKLLTRALYCLLDNAITYQPEDQAPVISISATQNGRKTVICVEDNGIGMKPESVSKAMIILRRLHGDDAYKGRGVGMSFAKKVAEIHGGKLSYETEPDKGTRAFLELGEPLPQVSESEKRARLQITPA